MNAICPCHDLCPGDAIPAIVPFHELQIKIPLISILSTRDLGSLYGAHLRNPVGSRLDLADSADLVTGVAGDADVVATLERKLDIADLEGLGATFLGIFASCLKDLINEVVGDLKNRL